MSPSQRRSIFLTVICGHHKQWLNSVYLTVYHGNTQIVKRKRTIAHNIRIIKCKIYLIKNNTILFF